MTAGHCLAARAPREPRKQVRTIWHTRRAIALGLGAFLLAGSASTSPNPAFDRKRGELLAVEASWNEAIRTQDVALLSRLLSDDFELIVSPDRVIARTDLLRTVAERKWQIVRNGCRSQNVRLYGDSAVVTGIYFEMGRDGARNYRLQSRYTDVYWKEGNRWRAVSAHASPAPPVFEAGS